MTAAAEPGLMLLGAMVFLFGIRYSSLSSVLALYVSGHLEDILGRLEATVASSHELGGGWQLCFA